MVAVLPHVADGNAVQVVFAGSLLVGLGIQVTIREMRAI